MNLIKSTGTFSFFTIISRLLGYVRDILIAIFLGAGPIADVFFVAFRIPNTFRRLFSEGTFNAAFVPSYSSLIDNKKKLEINLVSTVNHYGSMNNGHYTCLNIKENKVIDDETIIKTDCNNLFKNNNNIYMLFYKIDFVI